MKKIALVAVVIAAIGATQVITRSVVTKIIIKTADDALKKSPQAKRLAMRIGKEKATTVIEHYLKLRITITSMQKQINKLNKQLEKASGAKKVALRAPFDQIKKNHRKSYLKIQALIKMYPELKDL